MAESLNPRVLLADDDHDIRSVVSSALSILGFEVIEAVDGKQALELFEASPPDIVVLDVMMPILDGLEVCRQMKRHPEGLYIPILMLTARDAVKDKVSALDGGADDYVTKPFNYQELQARVRALHRVRQLNLRLREKNRQLAEMQEELVQKERQLLATQLGGGAAHELGQPLAALTLNLHLLERLPKDDDRFMKALDAMKSDARRMSQIIEKLRSVDATKTTVYHGAETVVSVSKKE